MLNHYQVVIQCLNWGILLLTFSSTRLKSSGKSLELIRTSIDCIAEASIPPFDSFKPVSAEDIEKVIMSSSNKSCLCGYVKTMLVLLAMY